MFHNEDKVEDDVPLSVLKEQSDNLVSASPDVANVLKLVNPNIPCTPCDNNIKFPQKLEVELLIFFNQALDWTKKMKDPT